MKKKTGRLTKIDLLRKKHNLDKPIVAKCPVFQPGDPRIEETLLRGGGVGVDFSQIGSGRDKSDFRFLNAPRTMRFVDVVREANEVMLPVNEKYPQKDEDGDES